MTAPPSLIAVNGMWAGLGNRLRFTLSACAVAEAEGRDFAYVWPTSPGTFGPALTELWEFDAPRVDARLVVPNLTERPTRFARPHALLALRNLRRWTILGTSVLVGDGSERSWLDLLAALRLAEPLARRVEAEKASLPDRYVGVQVRANERSHAETLSRSPVTWFLDRMGALAAADPYLHFFLSCDDAAAQAQIQKAVPRVHALAKTGAYNSTQGVQEAVVDLHLLARSSHLIGPHMSSFVELAWFLGGRRQELETSVRTLRAHHSPGGPPPGPAILYRRPQLLVGGRTALRRLMGSTHG